MATPLLDEDLDRFFSVSTEVLCVIGFDGIIRRVNPTCANSTGFTTEELVGRPVLDFAHPAERRQLTRAFRALLNGRTAVPFECRFRNRDGAYRRFSGSAIGSPARRLIYVAAVELDRRDASARDDEKALRETEEKFRLLVEGVKDYAIFMLDREGRVASWNHGAERILGFREPEILGRSAELIFTPEDRASNRLERELNKAAESGQAEDERWHMRRDGTRFFASGVMTALRDEKDELRGFAKVMRDITERRRTEEALLQAQKLESIGLLAGGVAHDFNNLLTGIMGNASLVYESTDLADPARELLGDVIASSERAADLTRQLLAYAGKGRLIVERLDLSRMVSDILHLIQTSIPKKIELRLDLPADLPAVEADASQIQQIIMNLTINAAEAIGDGEGTIHVSTGVDQVGEAGVPEAIGGRVEPGRYVYLDVSDTGSGMDAETISRIFDPFFTTKFTGRGLGLAAVSGIVRGHKGALIVHSAPGAGATFRVLLLAAQQGAEPGADKSSSPDLRGAGVVLVVDDEELVRRMAKVALERYGYRVELAEEGRQAIGKFNELRSEIVAVLLDMELPVVSGLDAFEEIRRLGPEVPVVVSTGYSEQVARQRLQYSSEVAGFLQKPYTAVQLAEQVRLAIGSR